jgi:hypothetical protein
LFDASNNDTKYLSKIWPTVFILGVQKGGTTSLANFLLRHPHFCKNTGTMAGKESHFNLRDRDYYRVFGTDQKCSRWARDADRSPAARGTGPPILNGRVHLQGQHLDATPLLDDTRAPKRLFSIIPRSLHEHLKFVLLLREPLSRDVSMYNHVRGIGAKWGFCPETKPQNSSRAPDAGYHKFLSELVRCSKPDAGCSKCMRNRLEHGHYARILSLWFSRFKRKQFFVLQSDALNSKKKSNQEISATLRALGNFLGIKNGDAQWAQLLASGYLRSHTAEGHVGVGNRKASLEDLGVDECQAAAGLYTRWNEDLYRLMHSTQSTAPVGQPVFERFPDPCRKRNATA